MARPEPGSPNLELSHPTSGSTWSPWSPKQWGTRRSPPSVLQPTTGIPGTTVLCPDAVRAHDRHPLARLGRLPLLRRGGGHEAGHGHADG